MEKGLINFQDLIEVSNDYWKKLRFEIRFLSVLTSKGWDRLDKLEAEELNEEGEKIPIILRDILLDTGNEVGFCLTSTEFLEPFNKTFFNKELEFEERIIGSVKDNAIVAQATKINLKFKLFNTLFISKIGFADFNNQRRKSTINIGIHCINQFLNILFFENKTYYYFCSNIKSD